MIKVNLLGEKKDYSELLLKHSLVLGFLIFIAFSISSSSRIYVSSNLEKSKNEKQELLTELGGLRNITKDVDGLEKKKRILKEKLTTIAKLRSNKYSAVKFLDDMTSAIPERSWLTAIKPGKAGLEIQGLALDSQTVSSFMHSLEQSKWIQSIEFGYTRQALIDEVPVQEFLFTVKVKGMSSVSIPKNQKAKS